MGVRRSQYWGFGRRMGTSNLVVEVSVQRLFSIFPDGWPGRGLLLLRLVAAIFLINDGVRGLLGMPGWPGIVPPSLGIAAGVLLVAGLWTPMTGVAVVIVELWCIASRTGEVRDCVVLATFGAALAMLGPGVRSVDARLFGRKRIDV